ncbi:GtrA family protein [Haloarcula sp. AONF1]
MISAEQILAETLAKRTPLGRYASAEKIKKAILFGGVGATGIAVDAGIMALALEIGVWYMAANGLGYIVAVTSNFSLNYWITWDRPSGSVWRMFGQYLSADIGLFAVRVVIVGALVELAAWPALAASLVGILVVAAATFVVADQVVFDESE